MGLEQSEPPVPQLQGVVISAGRLCELAFQANELAEWVVAGIQGAGVGQPCRQLAGMLDYCPQPVFKIVHLMIAVERREFARWIKKLVYSSRRSGTVPFVM